MRPRSTKGPACLLALFCVAIAAAQNKAGAPRLGIQVGADDILKASLSRDGKWLLTGGSSATAAIRLYDVPTGRLIRSFVGHTGTIYRVALSPDSHWAASTADDRTLRFWDVRSGKLVRTIQSESFFSEVLLNWSPDGKYVVTSSRVTTGTPDQWQVQVWDASTGAIAARLRGGHEDSQARFSPDGKFLYYFSSEPQGFSEFIAKADAPNFKLAAKYPVTGYPNDFVGSDDNHTLTYIQNDLVETVDQASGKTLQSTPTKAFRIYAVPNARWGTDIERTTGSVVDLMTGRVIGSFPRPDSFYGEDISANGRVVAFCGHDSVTCFDTTTGKQLCDTVGQTTPVVLLTHPAPNLLATDSRGPRSLVWDLKLGQPSASLHGPPLSFVYLAACLRKRIIATGGLGSNVAIWDAVTGQRLQTIEAGGAAAAGVDLSSDGAWLAVVSYSPIHGAGSKDYVVQVFDLASGKRVVHIDADSAVYAKFSRDMTRLAFKMATRSISSIPTHGPR